MWYDLIKTRCQRGLAGCLLLGFFAGCGDRSPSRLDLGGTITVDQMPLSEGSIIFLPDQGQSGPAASTRIVDGRYQFENSDGPYPGSYRVRVRAKPPIAARNAETAGRRVESARQVESVDDEPDPPGKADLLAAPATRSRQPVSRGMNRQWETKVQLDASDLKRHDFEFPE